MSLSRLLLATLALLAPSAGAKAWTQGAAVVTSVCGGCAGGRTPETLALELEVTEARAHNPESQRRVIVNQPFGAAQGPISARY